MNVTKQVTDLPKSQSDVQVTVTWADIQPKWDETLQKLAAEMELPGFRKGSVPVSMAEQNLGQKLQDEVLKVVMPQALMDALTGTDIVPIDYPNYQVNSFTKGGNLVFTAKITKRPVIKVGEYKTIKAQRPPLKNVTDEEVAKIIDDLYKRWKARLPAGQARLPQGNTNQTSTAQPTQPVQGASGSLSFGAQPANSTPVATASDDVPNDEFAKGVGALNLADLKTKIKQDLEAEDKYNNELDYEEAILQEIEKITTVELPDVLIQDELNRMLLSLQKNVTDRGMLLDEYLKTQNKTAEQLKEEWRPQAEKNVRMELGLSEVARMEGVNISDEELQAEIDKVQDAKVKAQFAAQEPRMHLRHALRQTKTLNLLKSLVS